MESHKLAVKFYAENPPALPADAFIPVFHSWIQQHAISDHMLIDVADYAHVPEGPGTVLVAREANFYTDREDQKLGLLYMRKQPFAGTQTFEDRLRATFRYALQACEKMEQEIGLRGKLRFGTGSITFRIYDRLEAPNTPQTFAALKPALEKFFTELHAGAYVKVEQKGGPEELFDVTVSAPNSEGVSALRKRLG